MPKSEQVEIVVIGAGPGGYAAAFRAADLGKKVVLVDRDPELGGVCLNRGCIPSKALLHISKAIGETSHLAKLGVSYNDPTIDINRGREHKNGIVKKLNNGIAQMAAGRKVKTIQGAASFLSNNRIQIKTEAASRTVEFDKCIIAAGSTSSMIPGVPKNHPSLLTSKTALELESIPERLLVVGGGVIGLELGQVYAALGAAVSVVEFLPNLIPEADTDLVKPLHQKLKKQFESILLSSKVSSIEPEKDSRLKVIIENKKGKTTDSYDKVLIAVGRKPNSHLLNLKVTDIEIDDKGFIKVDI